MPRAAELLRKPGYSSWANMVQRCTNPAHHRYHRYGGRGIRVCERWRLSYEAFIADMGDPPVGTTLDRKDNDGDYEPGNCRWATQIEQHRNTSRNRFIEFGGKRMCISAWAEHLGVSKDVLRSRLSRMSDGDAMQSLSSPRAFGLGASFFS